MGQLKQAMRERILHEVTYQRQMSDEEIAELIDGELMAYAGEIPLSLKERLALQRELFDSFRRLDILQELVGILTIGIIGFILAASMRGVEAKLCRWTTRGK